ncbi:hypothetical protein INT43_002596 [Umbelopsis isabellina]|uniref:Hemerythrin-like domain-containing protein n=1 Tax=Mortierella isabellina TaxID=91625 RepID=A0A8H7UNE5_MORIS|nr:hypothetical protein INT43_002596 [Umbelopsis isabellina]
MAQRALKSTHSIVTKVVEDHNTVKAFWSKFKKESDKTEREKLANQIIYEIAVHSHAEELVLYPAIERNLKEEGKKLVDESRAEHAEVKKKLYAVDRMSSGDPNLVTQLTATMEVLETHIEEEENDILPKFEKATDEETLKTLGGAFDAVKHTVPTRPHPWAPDKPLMESLVGLATAPVDMLRDAARSATTGFKDK